MAHYYAILTEKGRTNRWGVLIEEGALTEGVRYLFSIAQKHFCSILNTFSLIMNTFKNFFHDVLSFIRGNEYEKS